MKRETILTEDYVPEWGLKEGMREAISNALDARDGGAGFDLTWKRPGVVTVTSTDVDVDIRALLLGVSGSREHNKLRGQFGEGLPLALLSLTRSGHNPVVYCNGERWSCAFRHSRQWDHPVLTITTQPTPKAASREFRIVVENIDSEVWAGDIRGMFLDTDPNYAKDEIRVQTFAGAVLKGDRFRGCIYNKGMFLLKRHDLLFGYDLALDVNRDRTIAMDHDIGWNASWVLGNAIESDLDLLSYTATRVLDGAQTLEVRHGDSSLGNVIFAGEMRTQFVAKHGPLAVPVVTDDDWLRATAYSFTPVLVPKFAEAVLSRAGLGLRERVVDIQKSVQKVYDEKDLPQFATAYRMMRSALILWGSDADLKVVDFVGRIEGLHQKSENGQTRIRISCKVLQAGVARTLRVLAHEVAHDLGGDGTVSHSERQLDLMEMVLRDTLSGKET